MKYIILNGPPNSGKDTLGKAYKKRYETNDYKIYVSSFKQQLYKKAYKIFSSVIDWHAFKLLCTHRVLKEEPTDVFFGMSPRQMLIHVSEKIIKPMYGSDYFGRAVLESFKDMHGLVILTDGGFYEELKPIAQAYPYNVVRLYREGCDFKNDTRRYLFAADANDLYYYKELYNTQSVEHMVTALHDIIIDGGFDVGSLGYEMQKQGLLNEPKL